MKQKKTETEFIAQIQETLEESVGAIDTETLYRLTRARKSAQSSKKRGWLKRGHAFRLSFATLSVAAVVLVFTIWFQPSHAFSGYDSTEVMLKMVQLEDCVYCFG